jgi:putative mRNA 3-end processing factor
MWTHKPVKSDVSMDSRLRGNDEGKGRDGTPPLFTHITLMPRAADWIIPRREGIYLPSADAWIDPSTPQDRALITHGHADHARGGHGAVLATAATLAIMECRYGPQNGQAIDYGEPLVMGDVAVRFVPAGHILGSAQIVLDHAGERVVVSGDYKRRPDPTCEPFEPVPCDIFVTEATFALPVFRHPDTGSEIDRLLAARAANPDRAILVGAYALGKAQRLITELRRRGHEDPIYLHGAMPSGWMRVRQRARQRNVELPLVVSDHADWDELTETLREIAPSEVWVTHGREEALVHWCATHQIRARALELIGREDEDD